MGSTSAPLCVEGAINGQLFEGWVEQHLAKTLRAGNVVVMDNLSSQKSRRVLEAVEERLARKSLMKGGLASVFQY